MGTSVQLQTPPRTLTVDLCGQHAALLDEYRVAIAAPDRESDAELLLIAAACYMRSVVLDGKAGVAA